MGTNKERFNRLLGLLNDLHDNSGIYTSGNKVFKKHSLDARLFKTLRDNGIVYKGGRLKPIEWISVAPNHDMAVHILRAHNEERRKKNKESRPTTIDDSIFHRKKSKVPHPEKFKTTGYRINFLGLKFTVRRPKIEIIKLTQPF